MAGAYVLMQVGRSAFVAIAGRGQRLDRIFIRVTLWLAGTRTPDIEPGAGVVAAG